MFAATSSHTAAVHASVPLVISIIWQTHHTQTDGREHIGYCALHTLYSSISYIPIHCILEYALCTPASHWSIHCKSIHTLYSIYIYISLSLSLARSAFNRFSPDMRTSTSLQSIRQKYSGRNIPHSHLFHFVFFCQKNKINTFHNF